MVQAVMVTSSFLPGTGGIESYLAELCGQLSPRLTVLAPGRRDGKPLPPDLGYETIAGPGRMLWPGASVVRAVIEAAEHCGTDRVLFGTPWPLALVGPRLRRAGLEYAVIVHGAEMLVPAAIPGLRRALARSLGQAELLLPVSDFTAEQLRRLLRSSRKQPPIERLRARVDLERYRPDLDVAAARASLGLGTQDKVILCLGRLVRRKGIHRLIAAMPEISRQLPDVVLVVAGTGPEEKKLKRLAERTGARVIFAGRVPDDLSAPAYAQADVFALPVVDRWFGLEVEGLGVVLLEAAACGTPCVTGRSGGTPEAVVDGVTGYVVEARDREELEGRLIELLTDPAKARGMGAAGRDHVARGFSSARVPEALLRWLSQGVASRT